MSRKDRRILIALLDLLSEHEESVIDSSTFEGSPGRDAVSYWAVQRSRRIWRRAQDLAIKLEQEHSEGA